MLRYLLCPTLLLFSVASSADQYVHEKSDVIQMGRYSHVRNVPLADQFNPLKVVVSTTFPSQLQSVGQAMNFLLLRSGYEMANTLVLSDEAIELLRLPLPEVHRQIGPITLDQALKTLAGDAFDLIVDPVHRKIAFELSSKIVRVQ
jgi:type IV pili sensor histidine kinase/response regulator